MVKFNGVNHLAMATGDMDKTIRFWRDLLGLRLVAGLGQPGFRHYFFQISDSDLIAFSSGQALSLCPGRSMAGRWRGLSFSTTFPSAWTLRMTSGS